MARTHHKLHGEENSSDKYSGVYSSTNWPPFTKCQNSILNWVLKLNPFNQKNKKVIKTV